MADNIPVPSLSTDGWVTNTVMKSDYLLSHFFTAERSQSPLFPKNVTSFAWILQEYRGDMVTTARETQLALTNYFGAYFPTAEVEVVAKDETPGSTQVGLQIYVRVVDADNKEFILAKLAEIVDAKIVNILSINNYGTTTP